MRILSTVFLLALAIAVAPRAWAAGSSSAPYSSRATHAVAGREFYALLENLDVTLIREARECKDEGEICKTNADCCDGLECSGDPQATCHPED